MMHLPNNTLLLGGKYRIVRFISSGGFGCTYEAEHVMLHKRVAIKEFFVKDFCNRDEQTAHVTVGTQSKVKLVAKLRKKFIEEAVALSQFHHENIINVTDVFEDNGTAYYVMDYIDGRSIHDILKSQNTIPESKAVKYITQVAGALKHVHSHNRLHLDIKPGNIMIDEHDNAILIDFGASKQYDEESGKNTSTLLGKTPGYAPIEQMGNSVQTFTPATDIYSLGATLYKMLSGITPPEANILVSDDEALKPLPSNITPSIHKAVEKAMQLRRKDRPQNIEEFLSMLGQHNPVVSDPKPMPVVVDDENTTLDGGLDNSLDDSLDDSPVQECPRWLKAICLIGIFCLVILELFFDNYFHSSYMLPIYLQFMFITHFAMFALVAAYTANRNSVFFLFLCAGLMVMCNLRNNVLEDIKSLMIFISVILSVAIVITCWKKFGYSFKVSYKNNSIPCMAFFLWSIVVVLKSVLYVFFG